MNITQALIKFMKSKGYTSLCNPEIGCGCGIEDLIPCGVECFNDDCELGYTKKCEPEECRNTECENKTDGANTKCFTLRKLRKIKK
jgi:hypothetical protein